MYVDNDLLLSDAQAVLAASAASTNYVDALAKGIAISPGARIKVSVQTAFTVASGTPTLTVGLQSDASDSAFGSVVTHITTAAKEAAAMTIGTVLLDIQIPKDCKGRYIRLYYTLGGTGTFTTGKLDASIALDTNNTMDKNL